MLFFGAKGQQRRPRQFNADMVDATGNPRTRIFFRKDHLLGQRGIAATPGFGPANAAPFMSRELLFPFLATLCLFGERGDAFDILKLTSHLAVEPIRAFAAEIFIGGGKPELHAASPKIILATSSRCQAPLPNSD